MTKTEGRSGQAEGMGGEQLLAPDADTDAHGPDSALPWMWIYRGSLTHQTDTRSTQMLIVESRQAADDTMIDDDD
ncbi:MAG: hypothetical protein F4Y44_02160 [Chloroflexi bacterium]|nr:hypothetical protein [Chloroflexota bacterium]